MITALLMLLCIGMGYALGVYFMIKDTKKMIHDFTEALV